MDVKPLQPENALFPIEVTLLGITVLTQPRSSVLLCVSTIALQLFRESYTVFVGETTIDVKPVQPEKAPSIIVVTLLGISTDVKPEQLKKAPCPIDVTLLGI